MKNFYAALILFALIVPLESCKKEPSIRIDLTRFTVTDSTCLFLGAADNSDWTFDATWSAKETALMNFSEGQPLSDSIPGFVQISAPCPNPSDGHFILGINTQVRCKMKIVCVNSEIEALYFTERECSGGPILTDYDFRGFSSFHKLENYRMYYAFYTAGDSMYYKGHGDFRIE